MRLSDREWPAWHPDQEVSAQQILGLEDFAVARAAIVDESAWGLDHFDWRTGLSFEASDAALVVTVRRLIGVTPAGEPVCVRSDEHLESVVPRGEWESFDSRSASVAVRPSAQPFTAPRVIVDLWIDVNPRMAARSESSTHPELNPPKLVLRAVPVAFDTASPVLEPHTLYLGRYRRDPGQSGHELLHRPPVRRLGGLEPHDATWMDWVEPLTARIRGLLEDVGKMPSDSLATQVFAAELTRLSFDWPALPLPALARRLRLVAWLSRGGMMTPSEALVRDALEPFDAGMGHDLPKRLAQLIPERGHRKGGQPTAFGTAANELLDALIAGGEVDYRAPIGAFQRWVTELNRPLGHDERRQAIRELGQTLERMRDRQPLGPWSRAVALITAAALESEGEVAARPVVDALTAGSSSVAAAADETLLHLYGNDAQKRRAGPMAFHWLAQAASKRTSNASNPLTTYFRPRGEPGGDRVFNYHADRMKRPGQTRERVPDVNGVLWSAAPERGAPRADVRIALVGPPGSGKSTILERTFDAIKATASSRMTLQRPAVDHTLVDGGCVAMRGTVQVAKRSLPLLMIEVPTVLLERVPRQSTLDPTSSPLHTVLCDADLLVLVLDPPTALGIGPFASFVSDFPAVLEAVARSQRRPLSAIAYTKADEYGVASPQFLRFVGGSDGPLLRRIGSTKDAWNAFARGMGDGIAAGTVGVARVGKPVGQETEWSPTRVRLLEQTRSVWECLLRLPSQPLLNGYFIAAEPHDEMMEPWAHRGVLQLLADFVLHLERSNR